MEDSAVVMPLELGRNGEESEGPEEEPIAPEEGCLPATVAMEFNRELRFRPLPKEKKCCPLPEPIRTSLTPPTAWQQWLQFLLLRIPILRWLWSYQPNYIIGDLISGITVAVMHIPQGLAYALLANLPPVYGLYASFMPAIVYAVFGTSRHLSMGTFAVVSLMVGESINKVLANYPDVEEACHIYMSSSDVTGGGLNATNVTYGGCTTVDECREMCQAVTTSVAITIAFITGVIMVAMSFFQLGFITLFLSSALVSGYTTAAAVHVATSQVRHLLGVPSINATVEPGPLSVPKVWIKVFENLFQGNVNWATIIISILACTFLIIIRNVNAALTKFKYYKKFPVPIPSQLILVAITTLISFLAMFEQRWAVSIVGEIPKEPPPLSYPSIKYIVGSVIQDSFVIAVVTFAVSVSLAQVFAKKTDHQISSNQELLAYGMTSLVSAFFSSYSPCGSLSRSTVQQVVGGKTQLVGIISSVIILAVILSIAPLFEHLPKTILAAVVVVALYGMFKQVLHLIKYWKLSKLDFIVWIFVFLATVLLGVDLGLLAGVMFSLTTVLIQIILPQVYMLGQVPTEGDTEGNDADLQVYPVEGVLIFQFVAPLCYLNVGVFRSRILIESKVDPLAGQGSTEDGCFMKGYLKLRHVYRHRRRHATQSPESPSPSETTAENQESTAGATIISNEDGEPCSPVSVQSGSKLQRSESYHIALRESVVEADVKQSQTANKLHTIIVDCSAISFVDSIGVDELEQIVADYEKVGIQVLLATVSNHVWRMLKQSGFLQRFGSEWLFPSIQSAVNHACSGEKLERAKLERKEILFAHADPSSRTGAAKHEHTSLDSLECGSPASELQALHY